MEESGLSLGPEPSQVFGQLRDAIYTGRLLPGTVIRENQPDQKVSQTTVRDALLRLQHLHLVERERNRRTTVANWDKKAIANLIDVRTRLETLACERAGPLLLDPLTQAEAEHHVRRIGVEAGAGEGFHQFLWGLAANEFLTNLLEITCAPLFLLAAMLRQKGLLTTPRLIRSHRIFFDALVSRARRQKRSPADIVREHVEEAYTLFEQAGFENMLQLARLPDAPADKRVHESTHREFLHWMPAMVAITDGEYRLLYANEEFERFAGKTLQELQSTPLGDPLRRQLNAAVQRDNVGVLCVQRAPNDRALMSLSFPITFDGKCVVGELSVDITSVPVVGDPPEPLDMPLRAVTPEINLASNAEEPRELLQAFFDQLPAVATWKDRRGRMVWANHSYSRFTGKSLEQALGRSAIENWPGPSGDAITRHDAKVRDTRVPYLTTDHFDFRGSNVHRLTIRFPIFDEALQVEGTATIGMEHIYLHRSQDWLAGLSDGDSRHEVVATESCESTSPTGLVEAKRITPT